MSGVTMDRTPVAGSGAPQPSYSLRQPRLPRWTPAALAAAAVAAGTGIGLGAGLSSHMQWGLIAALLYVAAMYVLATRVEGRRQAKDRLATSLVWVCFVLAVVPLVSLVWETISRGVKVLDVDFLTHSMGGVLTIRPGGGVYHAIIGTLEQVGIATAIAAPLGLLTAIYLVEYGRGRLAKAVTFFVDVMTGIPSIVAGLFILSFWIIMLDNGYSGFAGSMALAILMVPVVVRSTEEMLKLVPNELREASLALGVPKWRTILKVVLPTAIGGIATGVMLAVARIAGETAPIVLLVFGSQVINNNPFDGAQSSLPYYIYEQWAAGNEASYDRAWAAALVLIAFVMILNLVARGIARWKAPQSSR
ncbi:MULTISPECIES: phosphate ABC transporter permease PstA [Streptomyces]|uniref:Phosphate transport system permease protein PstA n=1 Tax=Streptomyces morookaense TaxID=1970 RepID=A0A7Y7EAS7_STRMO|nr:MULTISPECIES: phosphate ABC transporter permease PstA [Streptomyces]MCC2278587.1 phosphate ABC transporter permease PstA [Streptomyces sp. ET3-23]NVK81824.1 phosphate ABC transporter permease PstA [Streptomyces morookaense]GHF18996.1 phosphate transport system permease protein PstA [Streptomyces morookaense]